MCDPIIGGAIIGGAASLYGASKQASAAKKATAAQTTANTQAIQLQREQRDLAGRTLQPYVDRGNQAFGMMAPHLGMSAPRTPTLGAGYASTGLSSGYSPGQTYMDANPDVRAAFDRGEFGNRSLDEAADFHMQRFGQAEGRPGMTGGVQGGRPGAPGMVDVGGGRMMPGGDGQPMATTGLEEYQTPEQAQETAWNNYRTQTTYGKIGDYEASKARGEFMDLAGSDGTALSGRTMRGMAEVGEEAAMRNFQGYMGMLGGISDQGYGASTGIASAGQTFADNASQLTQASGQARAAGSLAQGDAWQTGLADAAGWGGWAVGQMGQRPASTKAPAARVGSGYTDARGWG